MTLYEKHIGRLTTIKDLGREREWYVSRILTKEQMIARDKFLYQNKPKQKPLQLQLFI